MTTEQALRRARELGLGKNDPMVSGCIGLMDRYLRGQEAWPDTNEKHYGFEIAFKTLIAANLSLFEPEHPLVQYKRQRCAEIVSIACSGSSFREEVWERENRSGNEILLKAYMVYPIWLLQYENCLDEEVQKRYLEYVWHREEGIYYISNIAVSDMQAPFPGSL